METFIDTFSGGTAGGTNNFGGGSTGGGYEWNFNAVGGTGGEDLNSNSMFEASPWGSLSEVGYTSLEQVFRGSTGGNLARDDGNASGGDGNTSDGGGNPSADSGADNSPEVAIEGSTDITGSSEGNSTTSGDALLSGGAGNNSTTSGFSLRSSIDSYFISDEFSNNFSEVPNNTGTDSVLPISGGTGSSTFGGSGMGGSGSAPSEDLFGQSPWGRLGEVGVDNFGEVFGGVGAA